MRGIRLPTGAAAVLAAAGLAALVLGGVLWTRHPSAASQSEGAGAISAASNRGGASAQAVGQAVEETAPAVEDEAAAPAPDPGREAAAGPQPDDGSAPAAGPALEPAPAGEATPSPAPTSAPGASTPVRRVGLQAGHWKSAELPDELAGLRNSVGTSGGGKKEWQLNLDIAQRVAALLQAKGVEADVLPATIPPDYKADAFVALHADGDASGQLSGFKLARAGRSAIPNADDALLAAIAGKYQAATNLPVDKNITRNMTGYYAFGNRRFEHAIDQSTPAVILEMGFLTNASDRRILLGAPEKVAEGIAQGILGFLNMPG